jgi:hypothetical protein
VTKYRIEYKNDHGDWILRGEYSSREKAEQMAMLAELEGYEVRIETNGVRERGPK